METLADTSASKKNGYQFKVIHVQGDRSPTEMLEEASRH